MKKPKAECPFCGELKKLHRAILKTDSSHAWFFAWFFMQQAYDKKRLLSYGQMVAKIKDMIGNRRPHGKT